MKGLKKIILFMALIALVFSSTACTAQKSSEVKTYLGTGEGIHGSIEVEVSLQDKKITDIKVLKQNETPDLGGAAITKLIEDMLKYQSIAIDTVSGATLSSNGLIAAVTKALEQAGVNLADYQKKPEKNQAANKTINKETEVVIIGGGGSGLAAAVSAHQNGAKVLVLEKMPNVGGNTLISGAAYNAVDPKRQGAAGIEDSIEKHYTHTYEGGDKLGKPELVRTLVENAYPTLEWLESLGMKYEDTIETIVGSLWARGHIPVEPLGTGYVNAYMNYIKQHSDEIEIITHAKATDLIVEDGRITGVNAEGENGKIVAKASKGVIIATGGFSANVEMRESYNTIWPSLKNLKTTNQPGATGDGIVMAEKVGANLIGMEYIQLHPTGDPKTGGLDGNVARDIEDNIFVNKNGQRFVDEGSRRDVMSKAILEQEGATMWVIVDKHSYPEGSDDSEFFGSIDSLIAEGRAYKADTLEELAQMMGINPENLVKTVAEFNKHVESKTKDQFGRTLYRNKIDTAPFYGGARVPVVHHTMGGIEINKDAQVLDKDGKIIPGLYASGEVTGGVHGSNRLGGNAMADINVFGKIAGASAAKN
ncbi:flavocytochrome c [Desulfitobacterium dehalogenans ATCC 51507]|uniref:Urocanate reductase n=1 Tax=Desulfitobacterium dehalogenans (strain ATCC 51507 / DSM 9161 / JW/IU-DC1) TaxID=756499 RepID=I4A495_DESDJ|nr:flavocytochrome c [Desulfitobacterium dehalogenans]AFL98779.1 flavocytochrome c [Desulfitobacterium dehalogenans ATCC 51507]